MSDLATWQTSGLILRPDARLVLSEWVMAEVVMETPGGRLWVNEKTGSVGIKLLRQRQLQQDSVDCLVVVELSQYGSQLD